MCGKIDKRFLDLIEETIFLADYAVELRYDLEFWPDIEDVKVALDATNKIKQLVLLSLPKDLHIINDQDNHI